MFYGIDTEKVDLQIKRFLSSDYKLSKKTLPVTLSMTSFPDRMPDIHYTMYSLFTQNVRPKKFILWLDVDEFPQKEKDLPSKLLLFKRHGLDIRWTGIKGSYGKLIPSLTLYPKDIIITVDDDAFYKKECLERLYLSYLEGPDFVHCHRAHRITLDSSNLPNPYSLWNRCVSGPSESYLNWFTGVSGVLYPPNILNEKVYDMNLAQRLAPLADDIWFWSMALMNKKKIKVVRNNYDKIISVNLDRALRKTNGRRLSDFNVMGGENDEQLKNVIRHFSLSELFDVIEN